jgi:hypothetical protein
LCLCSLHVREQYKIVSLPALGVGEGELGTWKAHNMLLGEEAMAEAVGWVGGIRLAALAPSVQVDFLVLERTAKLCELM